MKDDFRPENSGEERAVYIGSPRKIKMLRFFDDLRLSEGVVTPRIELLFRDTISPALFSRLKAISTIEVLEWVGAHVKYWGL